HDRGLKNIIIWEIGEDLDPDNANSMLRRAFNKNESFTVVPGDYDGSGSVGPEDYDLWKSTYGASDGDLRADGNQNGIIDAADYAFWRNNYLGEEMLGSGSSAGSFVPEPTTGMLTTLLVVLKTLIYRRRGIGSTE